MSGDTIAAILLVPGVAAFGGVVWLLCNRYVYRSWRAPK